MVVAFAAPVPDAKCCRCCKPARDGLAKQASDLLKYARTPYPRALPWEPSGARSQWLSLEKRGSEHNSRLWSVDRQGYEDKRTVDESESTATLWSSLLDGLRWKNGEIEMTFERYSQILSFEIVVGPVRRSVSSYNLTVVNGVLTRHIRWLVWQQHATLTCTVPI